MEFSKRGVWPPELGEAWFGGGVTKAGPWPWLLSLPWGKPLRRFEVQEGGWKNSTGWKNRRSLWPNELGKACFGGGVSTPRLGVP